MAAPLRAFAKGVDQCASRLVPKNPGRKVQLHSFKASTGRVSGPQTQSVGWTKVVSRPIRVGSVASVQLQGSPIHYTFLEDEEL